MKLKIKRYYDGNYYLGYDNTMMFDKDIAQYLNIHPEDYLILLKKHNAYKREGDWDYLFDNREDAQNALTELEPHEIMNNLTGV